MLNLSRADAALSELSGLGRVLPNPHVLIDPLMRREAVLSSRIEGTQASLSDVFLDEATPTAAAKSEKTDDLLEVHNGRVGRLLITLFLIERGRLSQPVLYLSDFVERHKSDYYELLQRVRTHGEWIPWIRYSSPASRRPRRTPLRALRHQHSAA